MQSESFSSFPNLAFFCFARLDNSDLSYSWFIVSNTVSETLKYKWDHVFVLCKAIYFTSFCHRSDMTRGKFLYNSWSASVSFKPLVSSSSKDPMSKASAALTSPLGGIRGGGYFCWYTCTQSTPVKKGWVFSSSAPCPPHPSLLSTSLWKKQTVLKIWISNQ